eukprot:GEZU01010096.1.p1 GENE.GEZU01010096.1~~GEZU01010096.1.p1  ORF type:complete len:404 (-),score=89.54 GEZU01010096.1:145-1266(-)
MEENGTSGTTTQSSSRESVGSRSILSKLSRYCEEGKFYEAQQMYKSMSFRYIGQRKYDAALDLLTSGVKVMSQHNQVTMASELSLAIIDAFGKANYIPDEKTLAKIEEIASFFPDTDEGLQFKIKFLEEAVQWSIKSRRTQQATTEALAPAEAHKKEWGPPHLHLALARAYWKAKRYAHAQSNFNKCSSPEENARMIFEWAQAGDFDAEWDMFIARPILHLLCLHNINDAMVVLAEYMKMAAQKGKTESPLTNFLKFSILAAEKRNYALFQKLKEKYAPSLARDKQFGKYVDKISSVVFGARTDAGQGGLGGLFNNLLSGLFGGGGASSSGSGSSSSSGGGGRFNFGDTARLIDIFNAGCVTGVVSSAFLCPL